MRDATALRHLQPFTAVYLTTFCAFTMNAALISAMPQGFRLYPDLSVALCAGALLTMAGLWLAGKGMVRLAAVLLAFANIWIASPLNILGHLTPAYLGRALPFVDDALGKADAALGFDWVGYFQWHAHHPSFSAVCRLAYLAWPLLALTVVLALAHAGDIRRLARYLVATSLCLGIVYVVAIFTPSYGAYVHHGMSERLHAGYFVQFADFKPTYDALRAGIVDLYAKNVPGGAISFPSFHTSTVFLYVWAVWRTPARWMMLFIESLCFLVIPVQGAHFLVDMIAGGTIAVFAIAVSGRLVDALSYAGQALRRRQLLDIPATS